MTKEMMPCGSRLPVLVVGAFAEMPSDMDALADVIASALAAYHNQFLYGGEGHVRVAHAGGVGHAAHRGWARLSCLTAAGGLREGWGARGDVRPPKKAAFVTAY